MFRKLLLSAVLAAGTLSGLAVTTNVATAHEPAGRYEHGRFEVRYLCRGHWDCYGSYRDRDDAERAAFRLRHDGYAVRIEREWGR
jgi:hypothetical protein